MYKFSKYMQFNQFLSDNQLFPLLKSFRLSQPDSGHK